MNEEYKQRLADALKVLNNLSVEAAREGLTLEVYERVRYKTIGNVTSTMYSAKLVEEL